MEDYRSRSRAQEESVEELFRLAQRAEERAAAAEAELERYRGSSPLEKSCVGLRHSIAHARNTGTMNELAEQLKTYCDTLEFAHSLIAEPAPAPVEEKISMPGTIPLPSEPDMNPEFEETPKTRPSHNEQANVSPCTSLTEYQGSWRGTTANALVIRAGIESLMKRGYRHLITIRGDNFCALRSVLFSVLISGLSPSSLDPPDLYEFNRANPWLIDWKGGDLSRLPQSLQKLNEVLRLVQVNQTRDSRIDFATRTLNADKDQLLMEALLFHMLVRATTLYERMTSDQVSDWVQLFFARDESPLPSRFLVNILNRIGGRLGMEQVEMKLLADTLQRDIRVFRFSSEGRPEFEIRFKGDDMTERDAITICTVDDRHYNVPL